jgi:O-antigen/teichoic acid export membrane protein
MPEHFGLVGMVTALTAFVEMFRDMGLGTATIRQSELTHEQVSTLFWINTGVGTLIMIVVAGASPLVSMFYGDGRVVWVSIAISSSFFFGGLTIQHQALLLRHMYFFRVAFIQVFSTGLSFALGIALAWQGFEYWALVWKEVARAVVEAGGVWMLYRWVPGLPKRRSGIGMLLRTGKHLTGFNIVVFLSRNLDKILLGKFWGPTPVGLYKQAGQLLSLPGSLFSFPLTYIMTPALSALQDEPERYRKYYQKVLSVLCFGYMPVVAYLGLYAERIISVLLGERWIAAVPVLRILALAAFVEPIIGTCGIVMVTAGRTSAYFRWGVISGTSLAFAVSIGVNWGLTGVATAIATYTYVALGPLLWFSCKDTPISVALCVEAVFLAVLSSTIMSLLLIVLGYIFTPSNALAELGASLLIAPLLYGGVWVLLPRGKEKLFEHLSYLRRAFEGLPFGALSRGARAEI